MRIWRPFLAFSLVIFCAGVLTLTRADDSTSWKSETEKWREAHAADLTRPDGWFSLAGLAWLEEGDNSFGSAADNKIRINDGTVGHIAILRLSGQTVTLVAPSGGFPSGFEVGGGAPVEGPLRADPEKDKNNPHLTIGTLNMYVIRRADRFALRIKDSRAPALLAFHGLNWYAADPKFRVVGKWTPYAPQKTITLATLVGTSYDAAVPGSVEFQFQGKRYQLEPVLEDPTAPKLFFILRDTTSTKTTYPSCRFLYTGFPSNGIEKPGELVLDFNRLENPPCAYTPYATCPLPPQGNRLPIALPVGEKRYHD